MDAAQRARTIPAYASALSPPVPAALAAEYHLTASPCMPAFSSALPRARRIAQLASPSGSAASCQRPPPSAARSRTARYRAIALSRRPLIDSAAAKPSRGVVPRPPADAPASKHLAASACLERANMLLPHPEYIPEHSPLPIMPARAAASRHAIASPTSRRSASRPPHSAQPAAHLPRRLPSLAYALQNSCDAAAYSPALIRILAMPMCASAFSAPDSAAIL